MKTQRLLIPTFILIIVALLANCSSPKIAEKEGNKTLILYSNSEDYKEDWRKIDSLEGIRLTKSALEAVKKIEEKATLSDNHEQQIKSLIVKAKLQARVEENAFENTIQELTDKAQSSTYPLQPLLHSIIAEMYWKYYEQNRWKFQSRSTTINFKNDDIATWSLKKIIDVTTHHYLLSIKNIDSLQRTPLTTFNEIIIEKNARKYRPFLYDFLAHRAIDFFMNEAPNITTAIDRFTIDNPNYLASFQEFTQLNIDTPQYLSLKYHALIALQKLTHIHLNDTNPTALIDIELQRLQFVKNNATFPHADSLYYNNLTNLASLFDNTPSSTEVAYQLASTHFNKGKKYDPLTSNKYQWEIKTAHRICTTAIQKYPKSIGAKQCKHLIDLIEQKELNVLMEKVNIPNTPLKAKISSKNIDSVFLRIYSVDFDAFNQWNNYRKRDQLIAKITSQEVVKDWKLNLQNGGDFQMHSGEFKIDALPKGHYVLLASTNKAFNKKQEAIAITSFWVSHLGYISRRKHNADEFIVTNRETGVPIQGVKAKILARKYDYNTREYKEQLLDTKISNKNGMFLVQANV